MEKLSDIELKKVDGGGISLGIAFGIGALVTFILGFIDGYTRPLPCRK